jgi:hypothetical protein
MVCDANLLILQFQTSSIEAGWWGEMALLFFSVQRGVRRLPMV